MIHALPVAALSVPVAVLVALVLGCDESPPGTDRDTDTQDTVETASDSDGAADRVCIDTISGQVQVVGVEPEPVTVVLCIGVCFPPVTTAADGRFEWRRKTDEDVECIPYDFSVFPLHVALTSAVRPDRFADYAFIQYPTQETVSDQGEDDYALDLGELSLFATPAADGGCDDDGTGCVTYRPDSGATLDDGELRLEIPPDGLVKNDGDGDTPISAEQTVQSFKAPLDSWTPPFVDVPLDALYFIGPRWAKLSGDGVPLTIATPEGWDEGDTGTLYLLGGYISDWGDDADMDKPDFIFATDEGCINAEDDEGLDLVEDGAFAPCGTVAVVDGRIETPPIPRLTWVGLGR